MKTSNLKPIIADKALIAFCGLYCGACHSYLKGKCPGCRDNVKATWCKVRTCGIENNFQSCADCKTIELVDCKKFNNPVSKIFGLIFNSDRKACIYRIRENGYDNFASEMADNKIQTIKRKQHS
jgi:hypothetical protein